MPTATVVNLTARAVPCRNKPQTRRATQRTPVSSTGSLSCVYRVRLGSDGGDVGGLSAWKRPPSLGARRWGTPCSLSPARSGPDSVSCYGSIGSIRCWSPLSVLTGGKRQKRCACARDRDEGRLPCSAFLAADRPDRRPPGCGPRNGCAAGPRRSLRQRSRAGSAPGPVCYLPINVIRY